MAKEILVSVRGRKLTVDLQVEIHTGNQNSLECVFTFDDEWDGLAKTAVFKDANGKSWPTLIADDLCIVPHEATDSGTYFELGIFGVRDGNIVVTTGLCVAELKPGCYTAIAPPSEDIYLQILNEFSTSTARVEAAADKVQASADEIKASLPAIHQDAETAKAKAAEAATAAGEAAQSRDKAKEYQDAAQASASDALASAQAAAESEENTAAIQSEVQRLAGQVSADKADVASKAQTVTSLAQQVQETADGFQKDADAAKEAVTAEGTKQMGLVSGEGAKQVKAVSDKGVEQVGAVNAAGATQTSNAKAQADRAKTEADRAKSEADRAAAIDAYTKEESRQTFAGAFVGERTGAWVRMDDVCENTLLRKAAVQGVTTELLQNPEAEKSPDNIASISGAEPTKMTVSGKNLIPYKYESDTQTSFGITATRNPDGSITMQGINDGTGASSIYLARSNLGLRLPAGTYTLSAGTLPSGVSFYITPGYKTGTFTLNEAAEFTIAYFNISLNTDLSAGITVYPQLEVGSTAASYEPYTSSDYPLPSMEPLMSLSNGVCDEYDAVTGVETRRIGKLVFNGTENWRIATEQGNESSSLFYLYGVAMGGSIVNCTHLICRSIISGSETYTCDGIYGNYLGSTFYIRLNHSHNITTAEELKEWLAAQHAAGMPVTIYYELAEPVITQHDPQTVPAVYPTTTVYADAGNVAVSYNRDSNKVINTLTNAIIALGGTLDV